jgi:uncharacterized protein (TIGR03067 family)
MKFQWLVLSMVVLSLASAGRCDDAEKDGKALEGTWVPLSAELSGKKFPDEVLKTMKLVMAGEKYTVTVGAQTDQGTVKLDPAQNPRAMDIKGTEGPNKGKSIPAIYELKGDTLRVCYNLGGDKRPAEFKTKEDTQLFLVTYRREKL